MKVDAHIHSSYSREGSPKTCSPELIVTAARRAGMDGICITDHDTMQGYRAALRIQRPGDPFILPGCEVSTNRGHLLVLGVECEMKEGVDAHELVDWARSEGGVVSAPHPFYISTISTSWLARELSLAVETYNAMASILIYPNPVARKFARKYRLPVTGGSDAHSYEMVGMGVTESQSDTPDGFMADLAHGHTTAGGRRPPVGFSIEFGLRSAYGIMAKRVKPRAPWTCRNP